MFLKTFLRRKAALFLLSLFVASGTVFAIAWVLIPDPLPAVLRWPVSPVLLDREGRLVNARLSIDQEWCLPVPFSEMGVWLPKVLVAVEDKRFHSHNGVDVLALGRAIGQNALAGRIVSGASTITSQLVRLSTPRARSFSTKLMEFLGAWKLERSMSKEEILEYYLNRAPFGGPIRGVEAASRIYFGKRARELSLGEAALLVGLLKGPTAYRPDKNPRAALKRRQAIIAKVAERESFPPDLLALALAEPLPRFRPVMPDRAWHFADLAFRTLPPEGGVVRSSLDMRAQNILEQALAEGLQQAGEHVTAAGVIVDNAGASILAYVGNARFDKAAGKEWVDCALAPRSPGSTLKPFVYLAAMEEGLIIPATLLADTPLRLGGEAPRNFDRTYRGPVTAHTALADSLNAPAVRVLRMVGLHKALLVLRGAGFSHLNRSESDYGDSLVLGAGEVTVLELARAYSGLANLGMDRPLLLRGLPPQGASGQGKATLERYGASRGSAASGDLKASGATFTTSHGAFNASKEPLPSGLAALTHQLKAGAEGAMGPAKRLYSPAAAWLTAEILRDVGRLPFPVQLAQAREESPVAFKTGTSFGLRDAWTAAYCPGFTVVVWFGRADGGPDANLIGRSMAVPAAFKCIRALSAGRRAGGWYDMPQGVGTTRVCSLSGAALSAYCPAGRVVHDIERVRRSAPCSMHVPRDGKIALDWPPELEDFTRKRFAGEDLSRTALIVSPLPGAKYMITPGAARHPITLKAEGVAYPVHWYIDGEYLGQQERVDKPLYWLAGGGAHRLSLLDAEERVAFSEVTVVDLSAVREQERPFLQE